MMLCSTVSCLHVSLLHRGLFVLYGGWWEGKIKCVVLFLLEYPPSKNLCEERCDMPKQALKLFIATCYIMYCLTRLQNSLYFCILKQSPKQSSRRSGVRLKTESETGEKHKKYVLFFSLCKACTLHAFETLMLN